MDIQKELELALGHHRAGRLQQAERIYREILQVQPEHADALHFFGVLVAQNGRPDVALDLLRKAIAIRPHAATFHNSAGFILNQCSRGREAIATLLRALELDPDFEIAQANLVTAHQDLARTQRETADSTDPSAGNRRGQLVLGIGTGRCGSTTLVKLLQNQPGAVISHERPPRLAWVPNMRRLKVHIECFEPLLRSNRLVGDVSHWWLPYLGEILRVFPGAKIVALQRDREATIRSFEAIKGSGAGAIHHWYDHRGAGWRPNIWDECYPSYQIENRAEAIGRYWDDYYETVEAWRSRHPAQVLCVPTDVLNSKEGQDRLFDFLGVDERVYTPGRRYNVGGVSDGARLWG